MQGLLQRDEYRLNSIRRRKCDGLALSVADSNLHRQHSALSQGVAHCGFHAGDSAASLCGDGIGAVFLHDTIRRFRNYHVTLPRCRSLHRAAGNKRPILYLRHLAPVQKIIEYQRFLYPVYLPSQ